MNPEEDKIFLYVWLLYHVNIIFADSQIGEVRRHRRPGEGGGNAYERGGMLVVSLIGV